MRPKQDEKLALLRCQQLCVAASFCSLRCYVTCVTACLCDLHRYVIK